MLARPGQRVDYDRIAHLYDEPLRDHVPDQDLAEYLIEHAYLGVSRLCILDMGCGTGKQLAANREIYPDMVMVGLDLYRGMLQLARRRCDNAYWVQGDSSATSFPECTFDYVINQFSYSHVLDKDHLFSEAYRILKHGGRFVVTHLDPWSMTEWKVYRYFPAAQQRDFMDFLTVDSFINRMMDTGFVNTVIRRTYYTEKLSLREYLDYASQRYRTSQLMVISDQSYEEGLVALQEDIRDFGDSWCLGSEICLVTIKGDKP